MWEPYIVGGFLGFLITVLIYEVVLVVNDFLKEKNG